MNAVLYVSGQSTPQQMPVSTPVVSTLTETFPWLSSATSSGTHTDSLGDEFAMFAAEASEWEELAREAVFESWPDE